MDSKQFHTTPESLAALQALLVAHGVTTDLTTPAGRAQDDGWDLGWNTADGKTTITVYAHPFLKEPFLWSRLAGILGPPIG